MTTEQRLRINTPLVVSQEIEGEAILIHFDSGCYYSANATASVVLNLINLGLVPGEISAELTRLFPDAAGQVEGAVAEFLENARREGLLVPAEASTEQAAAEAGGSRGAPGGPFVAPRLERFDDLQDLLMLDPIHDVDAVGWPVPPPAEAATALPDQAR
jgi:hypothetical protein